MHLGNLPQSQMRVDEDTEFFIAIVRQASVVWRYTHCLVRATPFELHEVQLVVSALVDKEKLEIGGLNVTNMAV